MRALVITALLLTSVLSGCFASPADPAGETSAATTSGTASDLPATNATTPNQPPTANLTASAANGSVPLNLTFTIDGADPDGDNLTWALDVDGVNGTDANGTSLPATFEYVYEFPGNYTATLLVSDGELNATANLTVSLEAGVSGGEVSADDAGSDSDLSYTDLRKATFTLDDEALVAVLKLTDLWPTNQVLTPVVYNFHLNGRIFKSLGRYPIDAAPMTWDTGANAYMAAGSSKWDSSAKTVTFVIPLSYLEEKKVVAPYKMFASVSIGAISNEAKQSDRAPNAGELEIG